MTLRRDIPSAILRDIKSLICGTDVSMEYMGPTCQGHNIIKNVTVQCH
jgi:hypothetical protein